MVRWLASAVCFLFAMSAADAQTSGPYILSGTVTDASGALIPGASVVARQRGKSAVRRATTDQTGSFRISGLPPGSFDVEITSGGFAPATLPVTISGRAPSPIRITLSLAQ